MRPSLIPLFRRKLAVRDLVISVFLQAPSVLVKINNWFYNDRVHRIQPIEMTAYLPCGSTSSDTLRPVSIDFSLRAPLKAITNLSCYTAFLPSIPCNLIIIAIMIQENLLHFMVYKVFYTLIVSLDKIL